MKILVYTNGLGIGGTNKAAVMWACGLKNLGHEIYYASMYKGDYANELQLNGIGVNFLPKDSNFIKSFLEDLKLDIIHYHSPGNDNPDGYYLVSAIKQMAFKPYIVQTNVFGLFENKFEESSIDFTLFISWTSCIQSAIRKKIILNKNFFKNKSVVVYPLSITFESIDSLTIIARKKFNILDDEIVFGKIARPDMAKWDFLIIDAFHNALKVNQKIKLLLQEPPIEIINYVSKLKINEFVIVLTTTSSFNELLDSYLAIDVVLHTTVFGESFGYGIAEAMALSKPIITNSTPWGDQAQVELVQDGINGFIANTKYTISSKMLWFTNNKEFISLMGERGRDYIMDYSDYTKSTNKLESIFKSLLTNDNNKFLDEDFIYAKKIRKNLMYFNYGVNFIDKFYTYLKFIFIKLRSRIN